MKRILLLSTLALSAAALAASSASAQVFIRAPGVRVQVGPGVAVRAPFVSVWVPSSAPVYYYTSPSYVVPPGYATPPPTIQSPPPAIETGPAPKVIREG